MSPSTVRWFPFAAGLAFGVLVGGALALLLSPPGPADSAGERAREERIRSLEERAGEADVLEEENAELRRRVEVLMARASEPTSAPAAAAPGGATPGAGKPAGPDPSLLHGELAAGLGDDSGSPTHRSSVRSLAAHYVKSVGPPADEGEMAWAGRLLAREALRERITDEEAEEVANLLFGLPVGHAARPGLARAVAAAWGFKERLGPFLARFDAAEEPNLHRAVLRLLDDEHPGVAFGEYVQRLIAEARDPAVLKTALDLDIMEAAATAATAASITRTIEARLLEGTWEPDLRSRAGMAIAVACLRDSKTGVESLRRLAAGEPDPAIADLYRRAADDLEKGNATLKSLERLFEE